MVCKRKPFKKTCPSVVIETYVPKNNFYRQIKQLLKLDFLYQAVAPYYSKCGQKSIDPVVFFKLQLVAHFENICSDQALIEKSGLRLDILYFLDYNLGQPLPGP
jgi:transposase